MKENYFHDNNTACIVKVFNNEENCISKAIMIK